MTVAIMICLAIVVVGCGGEDEPKGPRLIALATTTSLENSGLLDVVLGEFKQASGIEVRVMPMGTGKALKTARDGNCDVVLVHAPKAEAEFMAGGWGVDRRQIMYNHFLIAGPADDPAGIKGSKTGEDALKKIHARPSAFVSRGDNSGTHKKEAELWREAGLEPSGKWYRSVGKGMGQTIIMANELQGYLLVDRGTFVKFRTRVALVALFEGVHSNQSFLTDLEVAYVHLRHIQIDYHFVNVYNIKHRSTRPRKFSRIEITVVNYTADGCAYKAFLILDPDLLKVTLG